MGFKVALVGDYDEAVVAHRAIPAALRLVGNVEGVWVPTDTIHNAPADLANYAAIWVVPASPYKNMAGALDAIRFARESHRPFLGTCGGFQHAIIEYARNVLGWTDADHAETNPGSNALVIAPLSCPLVEKKETIHLSPGSRLAAAYGEPGIEEGYHCSYSLNPAFESRLFAQALKATALDEAGEVRGIELAGHPFFVATLFQPERRALEGRVPPLVKAFCQAISCS